MKHKSIVERQVIRQKTINLYSMAKESRNNVLDFPKNQESNIVRWEEKIEEIKSDKYYTAEEKAAKLARCEEKIKEIRKSIEIFYRDHPWVRR